MENTLENKAKFFAMYWGQRVLRFDTWTKNAESKEVGSFISDLYNDKCIIELKPLSSISDDDCKIVFYGKNKQEMIEYIGHNIMPLERVMLNFLKCLKPSGFDYLRSRGYALPWMGLSVEMLIEYGWIKIKKY